MNITIDWIAIALIFGVMIIGGTLGAVVSCCIDESGKEIKEQFSRESFLRTLFPGIAAAFLVPVFLKLVSSEMVKFDNLSGGEIAVSELLYLFGFSIIASVSAKSFIPALSKRIRDLLAETEKKLDQKTSSIETQLREQQEQTERDREALVVLESYLNECSGADKGNAKIATERRTHVLNRLKDALGKASRTTREDVFAKASSFRIRFTRTPQSYLLHYLIPVLEMLIELDTEGHEEYHAELAYVLKDNDPPSNRRALDELNTAIRIRNAKSPVNYHNAYEYNRAIVKIRLDPDFRGGKPSQEARREDILADLHEAAKNKYWRGVILGTNEAYTEEVGKWIALNGNNAITANL